MGKKRQKKEITDTKPVTADNRRKEIAAVLAILVAVAIFKVVYILQYKANIPYYSAPIVDSAYYNAWAMKVAKGIGYGREPFYMAPLYPWLLGMLFRVAGPSIPIAYAIQLGIGLCNLLLVYLLGRKIFGFCAGIAGMLLIFLYAPVVYLETKILTETLAIFLNLTSALLVIRALERSTVPRWLAAGVCLGLSAVCRPIAVFTILLLFIWLAFQLIKNKRQNVFALSHLVVLACGVLLAILPVTLRNYFVGGELVPISTNGGMVFAQGNNPRSKGFFAPLPELSGSVAFEHDEAIRIASDALGRPVTSSESSKYWFGRALEFIRENPMQYAGLLVRKMLWSIHSRESECMYNVYSEKQQVPALRMLVVPFWLIGGLGLAGFLCSRRHREQQARAVVLISILAIYIGLLVFSVNSRYRAPAVPGLAVFAGFGLVALMDSLWKRRWWEAAGSIACVTIFALVALIPFPAPLISAGVWANMGAAYLAQGQTDKAILLLRKSIDVNPRFAYAHLILGVAMDNQGETEEAAEHYAEAVRLSPTNPEAHYRLGTSLVKRGEIDQAIEEYLQALRIKPDYAEARYNLGIALMQKGDLEGAMREYQRAIADYPQYAKAYLSLGSALDEMNKLDEAMAYYRKAIEIQPDLAEAHNNLAVDLYLKGDYAGAWKEVRLARKYGLEPNPSFLQALSAKMPEDSGSR